MVIYQAHELLSFLYNKRTIFNYNNCVHNRFARVAKSFRNWEQYSSPPKSRFILSNSPHHVHTNNKNNQNQLSRRERLPPSCPYKQQTKINYPHGSETQIQIEVSRAGGLPTVVFVYALTTTKQRRDRPRWRAPSTPPKNTQQSNWIKSRQHRIDDTSDDVM